MLSPAFRSLDPDPQQLERLASCSGGATPDQSWSELLSGVDKGTRRAMAGRIKEMLAKPGIQDKQQVTQAIRGAAGASGVSLPEPLYFGWPQSQWERLLRHFPDPRVLVLGILDAEGIWAGCLAGAAGGSLDFLATFQWLWADDPELASRQGIQDLDALCHAASSRFSRPAAGLFVFRDEFLAWRDAAWSFVVLREFLEKQTAAVCGISLPG